MKIDPFLAPAAAGDADVFKRRFAFAADQFGCVCYQSNEFASLVMLIELVGHIWTLLLEG
ncbi:MAG: hypothetical protein WCA45_04175 [Thiobacillaceae bacterium]